MSTKKENRIINLPDDGTDIVKHSMPTYTAPPPPPSKTEPEGDD